IFVAEGTYTENLTVNIQVELFGSYIVSGSTWLPGTPGASTINGSSSIGQPVVTFGGVADGAILNGFTVTGGSVITDGGGIAISSVSPIIQACIIKGNTGGSPSIEWGSGGILIGNGSAPIISNTIIMSNTGTGGASGIRVGSNVTLTVINSVIAQNTGRFAIHANGPNLIKLINVTIANQVNDGGILLNQGSQAVITNSIIWEPSNQALALADANSVFTVTYSDVSDGVLSGTGNLSIDPKFIGSGNYHLKVGSPVIDKGTSNGAPIADLEGTPRDARPDMGAYEWVGFRVYLPLALKNY
ncbi:MAG TPA: right-handed parallel beta-helix repeat-containing protein, partial [Anaerolineae bacterium]|nr:right-handed parallel beta-helix repeat-containing protein [Anaerolineae bacterium]